MKTGNHEPNTEPSTCLNAVETIAVLARHGTDKNIILTGISQFRLDNEMVWKLSGR